ncbi:hypothetical protein GCM10027359_19230 [Marilutibacter aestuarii]
MVISDFLTDDQDEAAVRKLVPKISELLTKDEAIEYIAVQKKLVMNLTPDAIVLTNRRFIAVRPKMLGMTFQDFMWREVHDVHMSEQMVGATILCRTIDGRYAQVDSLPKKQARRIYSYAQNIEEQAYERRQQVELEKLRASAGGVVLHAPSVPVAPPAIPETSLQAATLVEDPVAVLGKLKQLLEAGLIDQGEFDLKKAEVLARL